MSSTTSSSLESILTHEDEEEQKANMAIIFDRYKDRIPTLPKKKGWITDHLYKYQGFWYHTQREFSMETVMALQDIFQAQPTDIYLATHPKSGTTWLKALAFAIVNHSKFHPRSPTHPLLTINPQVCVPSIEIDPFRSTPLYTTTRHSPRLFATHIPYCSLPRSILDSDCRIVYICRNPKDVLVSLLYFLNKLRDESRPATTLGEAFEMFREGVVPFGPYWDHVVGYHTASLERPSRILFLKYEEMQANTRETVKKLAEFLGYPLTEEETVEEIINLCSFEKLKKANKDTKVDFNAASDIFFRKGEVGDATNHLTHEMMQVLDEITEEKFRGLNLSF